MLEEIELGSDDLGGISSDHGKVLRAIMENPDLKVRPNANGAPVTVFCNIYVCSFDSISETSMDYSVTMYVRHLWNDSRLEFNSSTPITVSGSQTDGMWIPDLFFTNSKDAAVHISTSTRQSVLLRITPRGEVLYTIR
ncbi:glycine receptor subunit alpha-2-like [Saccoglossus kowalevskii]